MDAIIQVNDLTKFYGTTLAVDHISFQVKEREVLVFLSSMARRTSQ
jgi:ABC-type multidrug transport system ATPase subunit